MYPTFLLYGIFIFSTIFMLMVSIGFVVDVACYFFPRVTAKILSKRIVTTSARTSYLGDLYEIFIEYQYQYKGVDYTSTSLNGFNNVRRYSVKSLNTILENAKISESEISIHVCPFYPKVAYALPFKWDKILIIPISSVVLAGMIFSGLKLGIF